MSRYQTKYAIPEDGAVEAALDASDNEYHSGGDGDDGISRSGGESTTSGRSANSSVNSSSAASSERSADRYADGSNERQMTRGRRTRGRQRGGDADQKDRKSGDPPEFSQGNTRTGVRKAAVQTTGDEEGNSALPTPRRGTRYDVPTHQKRRKQLPTRKEKNPTSAAAASTQGAASGNATAAAAAPPDKYAAMDPTYLDEGQIEVTLSPSNSYGVEVYESRNVSSRGYAFAKPLDKRYLAGTKGGGRGGVADGGEEDRRLPPRIQDGDTSKKKGCAVSAGPTRSSSVRMAKFSLKYPALPSKPISSALTENAGMHRIDLQPFAGKTPGSEKNARSVNSKELLLSMPVCDELSALHKEDHLMQKEVQSIKNERLVREIDCIKSYDRRTGRNSLALEESSDGDHDEERYETTIFQNEEWDVDVLLAAYAGGGKGKHRRSRKGTWKGRRHADNNSRDHDLEDDNAPDRFLISKQQKKTLERKRGVCLTVHISDETIQEAFKTEFADNATAIQESDAGGVSTAPSTSVRDMVDKYSTMAVSPESSPTKIGGRMTKSTTLTSTASKLITVIGCRALRSIKLTGSSPVQSDTTDRNVGLWYIFDDNMASCAGTPPAKFAERLRRERNMLSDGSFPVSNIEYMADGPLGSYFVRFASGEVWWGLGGNCASHREEFARVMQIIDVKRITFGPPCAKHIEGGAPLTVVPWIVVGSDGIAAWSSSLPPSLMRLLSDRPSDSAALVEVSLGAGGSFFVKFADGAFRCVVSSPLANVCRQIKAKGARITNIVLHPDSYDYIIRHSKFRKAL